MARNKGGGGDFAVAVDFDGDDVVFTDHDFEPGAANGAEFCLVKHAAGGAVNDAGIKNARGTDDLIDDSAFDTVNNKGTVLGHFRDIA
jgi:hypothetical protein